MATTSLKVGVAKKAAPKIPASTPDAAISTTDIALPAASGRKRSSRVTVKAPVVLTTEPTITTVNLTEAQSSSIPVQKTKAKAKTTAEPVAVAAPIVSEVEEAPAPPTPPTKSKRMIGNKELALASEPVPAPVPKAPPIPTAKTTISSRAPWPFPLGSKP